MMRTVTLEQKKRARIFLIVYAAYMAVYVARVNLSVAEPALKTLSILDSAQIGILGSCFFVVYALGRVVNGSLSDTTPPCVMICTGLLLSGLSNICFSFFPSFAAMCVFWTLNAYAQSMLWSSILCTITAVYEKEQEKSRASLMVTSVAAGNIAGILINSWLLKRATVRFVFLIPGILSILLAMAVFLSIRNIRASASAQKTHDPILKPLQNKELRGMSIISMTHGVMKENVSLWMAVYVVDTYCVDLTDSALSILLIPCIGFIGRIIYPLLFRLFREKENRVSLLGFLLCAAGSLVLLLRAHGVLPSTLALGVIYMAASLVNTSVVSVYPMSEQYARSGNTASVSGMLDFATYLGAGLSSSAYGLLITAFGYKPMFFSWAVISVISIIILTGKKANHYSALFPQRTSG